MEYGLECRMLFVGVCCVPAGIKTVTCTRTAHVLVVVDMSIDTHLYTICRHQPTYDIIHSESYIIVII